MPAPMAAAPTIHGVDDDDDDDDLGASVA